MHEPDQRGIGRGSRKKKKERNASHVLQVQVKVKLCVCDVNPAEWCGIWFAINQNIFYTASRSSLCSGCIVDV